MSNEQPKPNLDLRSPIDPLRQLERHCLTLQRQLTETVELVKRAALAIKANGDLITLLAERLTELERSVYADHN